ncbi:acyl-protein thioesterase 1 homolog 1-like [Battus philenor]|uniref:acyl-protein thioesterase 1 homolog 1-like n=1 Tax=Battus philenor TaxID=42288 RepID=UPI0035CF476C
MALPINTYRLRPPLKISMERYTKIATLGRMVIPVCIVPPLLQLHGDIDDLVELSWGQRTFEELKKLGVTGEFHVMERLGHSINKKGMHLIGDWIEKLLPNL